MAKRLGGCAVVVLLGLAACGGESETAKDGCKTAADCGSGQVCLAGVCKPAGACDPACVGSTPVCEPNSGTCKTCTVEDGCGGDTPACDTAANGGLGACVGCVAATDCRSPMVCEPVGHSCVECTATEGCTDEAPICDGGTCVTCTATAGCEEGQFCDLTLPGGECRTCDATRGCEDGQICDLSVAGGTCVTCTAWFGCDEGEFCDLTVAGGTCVVCIADGTGCQGATPRCDTSVPGGACVECLADEHCAGGEFCDPARKRCVVCNDADLGCEEPSPRCDVSADGGKGACVGCLEDAGCGETRPICHPDLQSCVACLGPEDCGVDRPYCAPDGAACLECAGAADCASDETCDAGTCRLTVSLEIQAIRDAPSGSGLALPIHEATVTYVRPATGEWEWAGFFVQGERGGPAVLIAVDPATLDPAPVVGDRVSFKVDRKAVSNQATSVLAIQDWAVASSGHAVDALVQDLSAATDLITGLDAYEGELVSMSGTIATTGPAVWGFSKSQFTTAGMPTPTPSLRLRLPGALRDSLGLTTGCKFRMIAGPMWRDGAEAYPSAYRATDLSDIRCP